MMFFGFPIVWLGFGILCCAFPVVLGVYWLRMNSRKN